jgi:hypothetical protein
MAAIGVWRLVPILCGTRQLRSIATIPRRDPSYVAQRSAATQSTGTQPNLGEVLEAQQALATDTDNPTSLSQRAVLETSSSKVRAVYGNSARTDLCGGRPAMAVPTAITDFDDLDGGTLYS